MAVTDRITSWVPFSRLWHGSAGEVWRALPAAGATAMPGESAETGRNHILKVATGDHGAMLLRTEAEVTSLLVGDPDAVGSNAVLRLADGAPGFDPPWLAYSDHGTSLAAHVAKRGPLAESAAANMLRDVLAGLAFAESRGVVHGALTPASVIIDGGFNAMLTDFRGDVWFRPGDEEPAAVAADHAHTDGNGAGYTETSGSAYRSAASMSEAQRRAVAEVPGWRLLYAGDACNFCTPLPFIAPEARGDVPLSRSDQWSAGMIATYALLGDMPSRSADAQLGRAGVSMTMRRIILRLTDPNPLQRYESAESAMKVVEAIYLARSRSIKLAKLTNDPDAGEDKHTLFANLDRYRPVLIAIVVPLVLAALAILMMNIRKSMEPLGPLPGQNAPDDGGDE